ncbi:MAG: DUF5686 and carboxypeptidase regulatory-like domain-containing protein [Bacteroidetes bacterium]|nr:DUF5686 and carboxypeptidase regulatory-like domain-containing protein [Bacteroidota bacterium]
MITKQRISSIVLVVFLIIFSVYSAKAQLTKIMGKVIDSETKEPVPFVSIYFKGTSIGSISDFNGEYALETMHAGDSLTASSIGYNPQVKVIFKNRFQTVDFELSPNSYTLNEVVIVAGENPADILLRKVIAAKDQNSNKNFDFYQYEMYNKIQFDANNFSEKFKTRKILQPFSFIFNHIDTSTVNGKAFLPVFLTETLSDVYYRKNPRTKKEVIKASKVSGFENESFSQIMGDIYQTANIYDNHIVLFEKNFVSPVANFGFAYYKYYLVDSSYIDNQWCYQIMFKPRRKQELTFTGNIWINDTTYAIKKVDMRIIDDANINFINAMDIRQVYQLLEGKYWMLTKDYMIADFNVIDDAKKTLGFYGHRSTSYNKFVFNQQAEKEIYGYPANIILKDSAIQYADERWKDFRHDTLTVKEKAIYSMIDSVKNVPIFKTYVDVIYTITNGYYIDGMFEIGPYYKMLSFNEREGARFRFGGRTSNKFSTKWMFDAYFAYGQTDEKFKYGGGFLKINSKNPRRTYGMNYKIDTEQLGQSKNAYSEDNFFNSFLSKNAINKLSMVKEYKSFYEHEWFGGFSNSLVFTHREVFPISGENFIIHEDDSEIEIPSIRTSEISLNMRFAYNEKFLMGEFERVSLGTTYPVFEATYSYGIPNLFNSDYSYHRVQLNLKQWFNVGTLGWSKYIVEAGRIWGKLPYPLLKIQEGNETYFYDELSYNLMNYYEFVSDQYISVNYIHHFDGLFLNRIPLMRKLKWREVAFIKGVTGNLSQNNKTYSTFPATTNTLEEPYWEAGLGIENIFKVIRVDAIWRLSHLDHDNINKFGIFFSFQFVF